MDANKADVGKDSFGDRLKALRTAVGISQPLLASKMSISLRSIQNYESNKRLPQSIAIVKRLAEAFNTTPEYLMGEEGLLCVDAAERGGVKAQRDVQFLVHQVAALFAGGELGEEDKDAAMRAITEAYWDAKEKNKKYSPRKYRK